MKTFLRNSAITTYYFGHLTNFVPVLFRCDLGVVYHYKEGEWHDTGLADIRTVYRNFVMNHHSIGLLERVDAPPFQTPEGVTRELL